MSRVADSVKRLTYSFQFSSKIATLARYAVIAGCMLLLILAIHFNARMLGYVPFEGDDWLTFLAYNLRNYGRLGDLMHPINITNSELRTRDWYYYGQLYSVFGAALTWLFGESVALQRAIHPIGLVIVSALSFVTLRKWSIAAAGLLATLLCMFYFRAHYPENRPDIMVSVFAACFFVAGYFAVLRDTVAAWFMTGLFACLAATSHLVAGSLVVACAAVWLVARVAWHGEAAPERPWRADVVSLLAVVGGGAAGLLIYLGLGGFRISALTSDVLVYYGSLDQAADLSKRFARFREHVYVYWWSAGIAEAGFYIAGAIISVGAMIAAASRLVVPRWRLTLIAVLAPPALAALCYHFISLLFYPNVFGGYGIFANVSVLWMSCAALAAALFFSGRVLTERTKREGARFVPEVAASIFVLYLIISWSVHNIAHPPTWVMFAAKNPQYDDYVSHVFEYLPARTRAWGSQMFGSRHSKGIDLIDLMNAPYLLSSFKPEARPALMPDYVLSGAFDTYNLVRAFLRIGETELPQRRREVWDAYAQFFIAPSLVSDMRLNLVALVSAPFYLTTRIYRVGEPATEPPKEPYLAVNFDGSQRWSRVAGKPLSLEGYSAEDMSIGLSKEETRPLMNARGIDLAAGIYLVEVDLFDVAPRRFGFIIGSPTRSPNDADGSLRRTEIAPYQAHDGKTWLLLRHTGGRLNIGQLDATPGARFEIMSVRPIRESTSRPKGEKFYADDLARCYDYTVAFDPSVCLPLPTK